MTTETSRETTSKLVSLIKEGQLETLWPKAIKF